MTVKAILIRVGIDFGYGGNVGPIFEDGSFEYVPIPETSNLPTKETRRYKTTKGRSGKYLSYFVSEENRDSFLHFDPEFETFTYGDHKKKGKTLMKLCPGDYLIFYAGLRPYESNTQSRGLFIIGYFVIENFFTQKDITNPNIRKLIKNNAHIKNNDKDDNTIIIKGSESKSKLLKKAIKISDKGKRHFISSLKFAKIIGQNKDYSLLRSSPRTITGKNANKLIDFIKKKEV